MPSAERITEPVESDKPGSSMEADGSKLDLCSLATSCKDIPKAASMPQDTLAPLIIVDSSKPNSTVRDSAANSTASDAKDPVQGNRETTAPASSLKLPGFEYLNTASNYFYETKEDLKALIKNPGDAISGLWQGAKTELMENPWRFAATVAGSAAFTLAVGVLAAALLPEAAAAVGIGITAATVGLLGWQALKALSNIAHSVRVMNDDKADPLTKQDAEKNLQGYGAGLLYTAGALGGAVLGGGVGLALNKRGLLELGPEKTKGVWDSILKDWWEEPVKQTAKELVKTLIPGGLIAVSYGTLVGAYGHMDAFIRGPRKA